ncbi:MAG: hypothetical protein HN981_02395 [Candidatus Pacebacteria bacterium]|nr:hypothetical protein [Candidatus Paceibacterota bacterium]MBT4651893.1 hypothetical protein [Candidatus Paceibacterota bacterium]MBT6755713.1 hypothetical protein [Candidatus Paceibacterota bacterium]MBT6921219.1 hypothetical protein [Candidatus Paceibacterota bacterium]
MGEAGTEILILSLVKVAKIILEASVYPIQELSWLEEFLNKSTSWINTAETKVFPGLEDLLKIVGELLELYQE